MLCILEAKDTVGIVGAVHLIATGECCGLLPPSKKAGLTSF